MGANTSHISDLSNNQSLKTLVGTESISENDPFWNQLISFTFISPTSRYTHVEHVELLLYSQNGIFSECGFPAQAWRDLFKQCVICPCHSSKSVSLQGTMTVCFCLSVHCRDRCLFNSHSQFRISHPNRQDVYRALLINV